MKHILCISLLVCIIATIHAQKAFNVTVSGKGKPVLFLPGFGCTGELFSSAVKELARKYECHVFTFAGFGNVPAIDTPWLPTIREQLVAYVREKGLKNSIVVGHSLGGTMGLWLAATETSLFKKIVVVDALPGMGALIWYFIFYLQIPKVRVKVAAGLMIGSILCRVLSEMVSHIQLGRINFTSSLKQYVKQFTQFYIFRKWVNFLIAPLTLLLYSLGFIYLLPALKGALSEGFYLYCVISGSLFLIGFSVFLFWNVRREMSILNQMKLVDGSLKEK